jgi:ribonucleoside-diphosphate reductase beta chain
MLLEERHIYRPFKYPFCFDAFVKHEQIHWLPIEITLNDDVVDWERNLNHGQKDFLQQLFRFFTQQDVAVAKAYSKLYIPMFHGNPEVAMMILSFAAREGIHVWAYSLLIDTLGLPETEYAAFMDYAAMREKYEFLEQVKTDTQVDTAKAIAIYSAFTEGMQLYASFAMLMHFERIGKMPAMTNIVRWSMRDEQTHADCMIKLFHAFTNEYLNKEDKISLEPQVRAIAEKMVDLEDKFIDLAFALVTEEELNQGLPYSQKPLTRHDLKMYIRHIADYRLQQLGMEPVYGAPKNPLMWIDDLMTSSEHSNFFEVKPTEYTKGNTEGDIYDY